MPCWNTLPRPAPPIFAFLRTNCFVFLFLRCALITIAILGPFVIPKVQAPGSNNPVDSGGVEYYDGDEIDEKAGHQVDPYASGTSVPLAPLRVTQPFCSFFDNRSPQVQPDLRNCTWYREVRVASGP